MAGEIDKQTFWEKVICIGDHKRFVGKRDFAAYDAALAASPPAEEGDDFNRVYGGSPDGPDELWVPENVYAPSGPEDDFNLVYSLATDGAHYPVLDLDCIKYADAEWKRAGKNLRTYVKVNGGNVEFSVPLDQHRETLVTPSTNGNSHLWSPRRGSFETYLELLSSVPGEDAKKYRSVVAAKGYGALRPPWVKKEAGKNDGE